MYPFKSTFKSIDGPQNMSRLNNNPMADENQWPNQAAYQHIDLETVDWAALAQQWIHMKESCVQEEPAPVPPPPPNISIGEAPPPPCISYHTPLNEMEEKGEAPMEVEREDEMSMPAFPTSTVFPPSATSAPVRYPWMAPSLPPSMSSSMPPSMLPPMPGSTQFDHKQQPSRQQTTKHNASPEHQQNEQNDIKLWYKRSHSQKPPGWNYWRNPKLIHQTNRPGVRPPLLVGPYVQYPVYNKNEHPSMWSQGNEPYPAGDSIDVASAYANDLDAQTKPGIDLNIDIMPTPSLDAAQRKSLPAWIREGLEKMERAKQKEADRQRELEEREIQRRKWEEQNLLDVAETPSTSHSKSKFESDSDDSDSEGEQMPADHSASGSVGNKSYSPPPKLKPHRTKAEILQDIMLLVRPNLTEILLEVTNEEIEKIAKDVFNKSRMKGFKAQTVHKNALASISGGHGLGLGIYADSDGSQSESDSEVENSRGSDSNDDSDRELKEIIDRRQRAFEKSSADIEAALARDEERERQWLEEGDDEKEDDEEEEDDDEDQDARSVRYPSKGVVGGPQSQSKRHSDENVSTAILPNAPQTSVYSINKDSGEIQQEKKSLQAARPFGKRQSRFSDTKVRYTIQANAIVTDNFLQTQTAVAAKLASISEVQPSSAAKSAHDSDSTRNQHRHKSERSSKYDDNNDYYHSHHKRSRRRSSRSGSESSFVSRNSSRSSRKHSHRSSSREHSRNRSRDRSRERSQRSHRDKNDRSSKDYHSSRSSRSDRSSHRDHKSSRRHRTRSRS